MSKSEKLLVIGGSIGLIVVTALLTFYYFHRQQQYSLKQEQVYKFHDQAKNAPQPSQIEQKLVDIFRVNTIEQDPPRVVFDILNEKLEKVSSYPFYIYFDGSTRILVRQAGGKNMEKIPLNFSTIKNIFKPGSTWKIDIKVKDGRLSEVICEPYKVR